MLRPSTQWSLRAFTRPIHALQLLSLGLPSQYLSVGSLCLLHLPTQHLTAQVAFPTLVL